MVRSLFIQKDAYCAHAVDIQTVAVQTVEDQRKELKMYSPKLPEDLVKTLYRIARFYKKPITKITNELIEKSINSVNTEPVCKSCIDEGNNDCALCSLSGAK